MTIDPGWIRDQTTDGIRPHRPMTEQEVARAKQLAESTVPTGEAEQELDEFRSYRDLLNDHEVLQHATLTNGGGWAIPVGGTRRGGFISVEDIEHGEQIVQRLAALPGFPNVRLEPSTDDEVCDVVRWGDDEPELPDFEASDAAWACHDIESGRLYGYREDAIREYVTDHWGAAVAGEAMRMSGVSGNQGC